MGAKIVGRRTKFIKKSKQESKPCSIKGREVWAFRIQGLKNIWITIWKLLFTHIIRLKHTCKIRNCLSVVNCRGFKNRLQLIVEEMLLEQNRHRSFQNSIIAVFILLGAIFCHSKPISSTKTSKFFYSYCIVVLWLNFFFLLNFDYIGFIDFMIC